MKRTLRLRAEHLADLTPAELGAVAGGALPTLPPETCVQISGLVCQALSIDCPWTGYYPSINAPCTTA